VIFDIPDLTLYLYDMNQEAPIDKLSLVSVGEYDTRGGELDIWSISSDGRWILMYLGYSALMVPIEYE
jgi:hypothetical protein